MSISRALLLGGPAKVTFNSGTFHSREDIKPRFKRNWKEVNTSVFGVIDKSDTDRTIEVPVRLWGAYENLSTLFPTSYLAPTYIGTRVNGTSDLPLVIASTNTDIYTFPNAIISRLANLHLGVDSPVYSADVIWTACIKNSANPEDAGAYVVLSSGAYSDGTFAKTNYKQQRYSAVWGSVTGFTSFQARDGWDLEWDLNLQPEVINAVGTVGYILTGLVCRAKCIPVEATGAQLDTASKFSGAVLGRLLGDQASDLTITGSGVSIVLKNAGIVDHGFAFGAVPLRNGEVTWETTVGFSAGAAAARATVA